ncbi:MAG: hypothetical protein ACOC8H_00590 [bacterium]
MAILALIGLTAFGGGQEDKAFLAESLWVLGKGLLMLGALVTMMQWVLPQVLHYLARSPEISPTAFG